MSDKLAHEVYIDRHDKTFSFPIEVITIRTNLKHVLGTIIANSFLHKSVGGNNILLIFFFFVKKN